MPCLFPWSGENQVISLQIKIILPLKLPSCYLLRQQGFFSKEGPSILPQTWANLWSGQRLRAFHLLEKLIQRALAEFPFQCNLSLSDKGRRGLWTLYYITLMWSRAAIYSFPLCGALDWVIGWSFLLQPPRGDQNDSAFIMNFPGLSKLLLSYCQLLLISP